MLDVSSSHIPPASPSPYHAGLSRIVWWLLVGLCVLLSIRILLAAKYSSQDSWFAMSRALEYMRTAPPEAVYDTLLFTQHIKFQYPPSGLLPLVLFNWLGIDTVIQYNFINCLALLLNGIIFAVFTVRLLGSLQFKGVVVPLGPLAFLLAIKFFPDRFAFELGQIQVLLGLLFSIACLASWHGYRAIAGTMIAATAIVKPQFAVFGVLALWRRDWRFLGAFAAIVTAALLISIGMYGWGAHFNYLKVLQYLSQHGECYHTNQSINGFLSRYLNVPCIDADPNADPGSPVLSSWFPPYHAVVYFGTLFSSLAMLVIPFVVKPKSSDAVASLLSFCTAAIIFTMASPIAWVHHYNILLPAYVVATKVAMDSSSTHSRWIMLAVLALSLLLTGLPVVSPFGPTLPALNLVQSHLLWGVSLLLGLLIVQTHSYSPEQSR